jgi:hypothetical protein
MPNDASPVCHEFVFCCRATHPFGMIVFRADSVDVF